MSEWIDITWPLEPRLAMWPGDTPLALRSVLRIADGAAVNLGALTLSLHAGTHADAPRHFAEAGADIHRCPLDAYIGPAVVVDVRGRDPIGVDALDAAALRGCERLLLRTDAWTEPERFPDRIPVMSAELPGRLAALGVKLVGLDVPSVDALDSQVLPNHHALGEAGIAILESLRLKGVAEGAYWLCALPLSVVGGDGSPVRAVLRAGGALEKGGCSS